jgi:hypothetical protein
MPASLPFRPRLGFAHLLIEDNDRILRIEPFVALLRVGQVQFSSDLNWRVVCAEQSLRFERIAHARVDAMHFAQVCETTTAEAFAPRAGDIHRRACRPVRPSHTHDRTHLVEALKRFGQLARRRRFDGVPIPLDARAFIVVAPSAGSCRRILCSSTGFTPACRSMASSASEASTAPCCRVSPERISRAFRSRPAHEFQHLPSANLARLVHDNDRAVRQVHPWSENWRPSRVTESRLLHVHDLLTLRGENDDAPARMPKLPTSSRRTKLLPVPAPPRKTETRLVEESNASSAWRCSSSSFGFT